VQVLLCGYGTFDAGNDGADHRVLWMDIPLHSILGYSPQRLPIILLCRAGDVLFEAFDACKQCSVNL
jgi:hypothetical protein